MYKDTYEELFQIFQTNTLLLQTFHYISTFDRFSSAFVKALTTNTPLTNQNFSRKGILRNAPLR